MNDDAGRPSNSLLRRAGSASMQRPHRKTRICACAAMLALGLMLATDIGAQDNAGAAPELRLSTALAPAFPLGRAGQLWAEAIDVRAGAAFEVRQFAGAVLSNRDPGREFQALAEGKADLAVGSALIWSTQLPALAAYVLPWLAPDAQAQEALAADAKLFAGIGAAAARAGVVVIAIAPLGERVLTSVRGPVTTPDQANGMRVRAASTTLLVETLGALGMRAEAMTLGDARTAFAAGALDGQEAAASTLAAIRIGSTTQKHVNRWGAFADMMVFAVRRPLWDGWTDELRAAVTEAARAAARDAAALAREDADLAELTRQGVTLVRPSPAQQAAFRRAVEPVWERWTAAIGAENVAAAKAAVTRPR